MSSLSSTFSNFFCWTSGDDQLGRRNLPAYVRAELALKLKPQIVAKAKESQGTRTDICQNSDKSPSVIDTKKELADIAGVSHDTITRVEVIQEKAPIALKQKLRRGRHACFA